MTHSQKRLARYLRLYGNACVQLSLVGGLCSTTADEMDEMAAYYKALKAKYRALILAAKQPRR